MPPTPIEVAKTALIYDTATATWHVASWNIFTVPEENKYAAINISSSGDNVIIPGVLAKRILITNLLLTVYAEVNLTLKEGSLNISGPLDFGGTSEPRGMVSNFGLSPICLSPGMSFIINLSAGVQVSGSVTYRAE